MDKIYFAVVLSLFYLVQTGDETKTCDTNMYEVCTKKGQSTITDLAGTVQYVCSEGGVASRTCARKVRNICIKANHSYGDGFNVLEFLPSTEFIKTMCADKEGIKKYGECMTEFEQILFENCTLPLDPDVKFCSLFKQTHNCIQTGLQKHCPATLHFYHKYMSYNLEANHPCVSKPSASDASLIVPSITCTMIVLLFLQIGKISNW